MTPDTKSEADRLADVKAKSEMERAAAAKRILEDPAFTSAVVDVRAAIVATWGKTSLNDAAQREQLWLMEQALQRVLTVLRNRITNGMIAERDVEARRKRFSIF